MDVRDLFWGQGPLLHVHDGTPRSWQVTNEVLLFIDERVTTTSRTLETGAGVTTVLFAMKGSSHTCIVPFPDEVERIRAYCREHAISLDRVTFEIGTSESVLPRLPNDPLDLVLIDGAHGFPIPLIDWYYTADRLTKGGFLVLDDTQLWSVNILKQFLMLEPEWRLEQDLFPRSAAFSKVGSGTCAKNEWSQLFGVKQTIDLLYPDHLDMARPYVTDALIAERARRDVADTPAGVTGATDGGGVRAFVKQMLRVLERRL
jgi:Methyltransferase domain